ncbi:MAG: hypothetical protein IJ950_04050, partial [Helicobacter sp.]|nr:hypothetical protein [Helicobacter sp.]
MLFLCDWCYSFVFCDGAYCFRQFPFFGHCVYSAIANAENNNGMDRDNLYVAECFVCPGPTMKR